MVSPEQHVPILSTKLYRPPVPADYVPRDALQARLGAWREMPLTVVSAPAGYGKSTLVSRWLEMSEAPSAWLCLDGAELGLERAALPQRWSEVEDPARVLPRIGIHVDRCRHARGHLAPYQGNQRVCER